MLTSDDLKNLLCYDPLTGVFTWVGHAGKRAGYMHHQGYECIQVNGKQYQSHRLAHLYQTGEWPADEIDHINRIRSDNRWENLREATHAENVQNRNINRNNASGHMGVCWDPRRSKWLSRITYDGRRHHLGYFDDIQSAARSYVEAKAQLHTFSPSI